MPSDALPFYGTLTLTNSLSHPSHSIPELRHAPALRLLGEAARAGGEVVAHVLGPRRAGDHAGDGGMAQDVLEEELAPACAVELRGPLGQRLAADLGEERAAAEGPVDQDGDAALGA